MADQFEQFGDLPAEGSIRIREVAKIDFDQHSGADPIERIEEPVLRLGAARGGPLFGENFFEALGPEGLAAPPGTGVADHFDDPVINRD